MKAVESVSQFRPEVVHQLCELFNELLEMYLDDHHACLWERSLSQEEIIVEDSKVRADLEKRRDTIIAANHVEIFEMTAIDFPTRFEQVDESEEIAKRNEAFFAQIKGIKE